VPPPEREDAIVMNLMNHDREVEAQLAVRTVLWVIVGIVVVSLVVWWALT
jgi:hypothetical protein